MIKDFARMRITGHILLLAVAVMLAAGCGKEDDTIDNQVRSLDSYVKSYVRTYFGLDQLTDPGEYYEQLGEGMYRVVENAGREGYDGEENIAAGDSLIYYFEGYLFNGSLSISPAAGTRSAPFYTNNPVIISGIGRPLTDGGTGLDPTYWTTEPARARLGSTGMLRGLRVGLQDARRNDSLLLFFTSEYGYGESFGAVPSNQPLAYRIYITDVKKQ